MDEQEIKNQYRAFYRAAIAKDRAGMEASLDESFHLTHMTGLCQSREEYIRYILCGTMNYYSEEPVRLEAKVKGETATLLAQSVVEAAVFGGGRFPLPGHHRRDSAGRSAGHGDSAGGGTEGHRPRRRGCHDLQPVRLAHEAAHPRGGSGPGHDPDGGAAGS